MHLELALSWRIGACEYKCRSKFILPTAWFNVNIKLLWFGRLDSIFEIPIHNYSVIKLKFQDWTCSTRCILWSYTKKEGVYSTRRVNTVSLTVSCVNAHLFLQLFLVCSSSVSRCGLVCKSFAVRFADTCISVLRAQSICVLLGCVFLRRLEGRADHACDPCTCLLLPMNNHVQ